MKLSKKLLSLLLCVIMVLGSVVVGSKEFDELLNIFSVKASAEKLTVVGRKDIKIFSFRLKRNTALRRCVSHLFILTMMIYQNWLCM